MARFSSIDPQMLAAQRQISDVEAFVRVVEFGGYAAAASALGLSRSHASRLVSGLEDRLGVRLLNRTTRRVVPTQSGRTFYAECAPLVGALITAEARVAAEREEAVGVLRLSLPAHMGVDYLMGPLARFQELHPGVELLLDYSDHKVDLLGGGFDAAVRGGSVDDPALVARRLWPFRSAVYASPAYLAARRAPATPAELVSHRCLTFSLTGQPRLWRLERGAEESTTMVPGGFSASSSRALAAGAAAGHGLVLLPEFAVRTHVERQELVRVLPEWEAARQWFWAVRAHRTNLPARVRLVIDYLADLWVTPPWSTG